MTANRIAVGHLRQTYLPYSETFIHGLITRTPGVCPHVMTEVARNLDRFPAPCTYLLTQDELASLESRLGVPGRNRLLSSLNYPSCFSRFVAATKIQVLHAHFGHTGLDALTLKRKTRLPLVTSFYGIDASPRMLSSRTRVRFQRLFRSSERVLSLGTDMSRRLIDAGCPESKIRVLHLGVDLKTIPFRARQSRVGEIPRILFCGRLVEKKGILDAIDALSRLARDGIPFQFNIVGDGPLRPRVLERIRQRNVQDRVSLAGSMPNARVIEEMTDSDLFLLPSRQARNGDQEGTPTVLLEAQASGLPVVSTSHADIPEAVCDKSSAFLVGEGDVGALADRLAFLLRSPGLWARMGRAGRAHVERHYNLQVQANRLTDVYSKLLEEQVADAQN